LVKTGTTVQSLKYSEFEEQDFPLPPLAEQHRIVAKVDELMKLCDRLEASQAERESRRDRLFVASLNTLSQPTDPDEFKKDAGFTLSHLNRLSTKPEHIKELRKTILNLAVRGKLVPLEATLAELEGRSYQSASQLVERLSGHPNRRKAAKQQSDARDCSSLPDLPNGWTWTTMPKIGELNRGRSRHRPRNEKRLYGGQYPFIQTGDVRRSLGTIQNYEQTYSEMGLSQSRMWPKNTLCITIAANIADTGILTFDACFPDSVVGFRYDDAAMPVRYIEYFLRTAKDRLSDFAPATAQKNINLDVLANVNVPLPPLAEQKRIVAKVDELMGICDQLEHQLESQQKGRRQLLEALLHEALEGVG
jgi:type I restriction enzyme S subunit